MNDKKKNSSLKIEIPTKENPSKLKLAEETVQYKKAGRKPIAPNQKASEEIGIKITAKQKESLVRQAGLVPIATYIKAKLKECGVFEE